MTDQQVQDKLVGKVAVDTVVTPGPGAMSLLQFGKSILIAVLSAIIPIVVDSFNQGSFTVDWKHVGLVAGSTALTLILAKLGAPTQQITTYRKQ